MKRAILTGLLFLSIAGSAVAEVTYEFGPQFGPSKPGPQSRWGYTGNDATKPSKPLTSKKLTKRCQFLRGEYRLNHMFDGRPDSLKELSGCALWKADHNYHAAIHRLERLAFLDPNPIRRGIAMARLIFTPSE